MQTAQQNTQECTNILSDICMEWKIHLLASGSSKFSSQAFTWTQETWSYQHSFCTGSRYILQSIFKILLFTFKALCGPALIYRSDPLVTYAAVSAMRSLGTALSRLKTKRGTRRLGSGPHGYGKVYPRESDQLGHWLIWNLFLKQPFQLLREFCLFCVTLILKSVTCVGSVNCYYYYCILKKKLEYESSLIKLCL